MGFRKKPTQEHKIFSNTLNDIRKLIRNSTNNYRKEAMGLVKHTKIPYSHLQGRRKKLRDRKALEKSKAKEENIQYDSSMTFLNQGLPERQSKDSYLKNQYKFRGLSKKKIGKEKNGFLQITQKQAKQINEQRPMINNKNGRKIKKSFRGKRRR